MSLLAQFNLFGDIEGFTQTIHCCLTDPNHPDDVIANPQPDALGNIVTAPKLAYIDPNTENFHIAYNSPCVDAGDPNETDDLNETDMDGEIRVFGPSVDIGADEAVSCDNNLSEDDIYNACDWNADGIVNYTEFTMLSRSWLAVGNSDPNFADPNYNPVCDLNDDWVVDEYDLAEFIPNWLWIACWRHDIQEMQQMAMMATTLSSEMSLLRESAVSEQTANIESSRTQQSVQSLPQPIEVETVEIPIAQQIADLQEAIQLLESIWNDPNTQLEIQAEDWQGFMTDVRNSLTELQKNDIITQEKVEE